MNILVTGASGFLGCYTVAELLRRGHQVRALVRPTADVSAFAWHNSPQVEIIRLDLTQSGDWESALKGVDAVVHLAAAKSGDWQTQFSGTVTATEHLLQAMTKAGVQRLIGISTFSVYDYLHLPAGSTLDEQSPLESNPSERDAYAQTKLMQERLMREFGQQQGQVTILRPGMVYGRDALWNACLGAKNGNLWLRIGTDAILPLTYVENCAAAIANAAEQEQSVGATINIVDDQLPTQSVYANKLLARMSAPPRTVVINWTVMRLLARFVWQINKTLFAGRLKLPGLLIPARLHARFKPLQYSNLYAKQMLNWTPSYSLDAALARSWGDADLLAVTAIQPSSQSPSVPS
ncbi:MAG: NAD-dependent epimerase/dehydratase family protein [Leptolyngbya sp. IPPAS B-1204]|nr:MAG: NAD(P)-dependent oxidoreductase [Leptolyngbya sp. IPPAS B-1204]